MSFIALSFILLLILIIAMNFIVWKRMTDLKTREIKKMTIMDCIAEWLKNKNLL